MAQMLGQAFQGGGGAPAQGGGGKMNYEQWKASSGQAGDNAYNAYLNG
jgi:hypothetical protein